jgi:hypothetical protein
MKRPYLVNFLAIQTEEHIAIKTSISLGENKTFATEQNNIFNPSSPLKNLSLLTSTEFSLKIVGINDKHEEVFSKNYDSDTYGNFDFRFPASIEGNNIDKINVYELSYCPGLQLRVGSFIPTKITGIKKLVISDFDKTLVDTKFSTPKEVYTSLSKPVDYYPKIQASIEMINNYIKQGHTPFILSASPHFYQQPIIDWLYQQQIYTNNIFLKDYRKIFSLLDGDLHTKDLKTQGFYKINSLISILVMTGIPDEMVLMGDGFESDTIIYLTLCSILIGKHDPWKVWNSVKKLKAFKLTTKQNTQFLSKLYQLSSMIKNSDITPEIKIQIRCPEKLIDEIKKREFNLSFIKEYTDKVNYYIG